MKTTFLFVVLALFLPLLPCGAEDAPDTTRPVDIEHMKKIGAALNAYKKAKGEFPDYLSDLVPEFLDAQTLISPLGVEAHPRAAKGKNDPKLPCSYEYEFGLRKVPQSELTFRAIKTLQIQEWGPTVPILRCYLYDDALNLSHAGDVFSSPGIWESDSAELQQLLKKNGLGPGLQQGRKLAVTVTGEDGHPVPGLVLRASQRSTYDVLLPKRDYPTNAQGQAAIPVGGGEQSYVSLASASPDWYFPRGIGTPGRMRRPPTRSPFRFMSKPTPPAPWAGS